MGIRSRPQLEMDQTALLDAYRAAVNVESSAPAGGEAEAVALIGKVTSVVTSDPTYGAHLVVEPQVFSGTPPVASAASQASLRAYPAPNHVVTDYTMNEYVSVQTARGALLALKLP